MKADDFVRVLSFEEKELIQMLPDFTLEVLSKNHFVTGSCTAGSAFRLIDFIRDKGFAVVKQQC